MTILYPITVVLLLYCIHKFVPDAPSREIPAGGNFYNTDHFTVSIHWDTDTDARREFSVCELISLPGYGKRDH